MKRGTTAPEPGRPEFAACLAELPRLAQDEPVAFTCAGCGDCCRQRKDLLLSGLDLFRLARHLRLPPRLVAQSFCRETVGEETLLPGLKLLPRGKTANCPFLECDSCAIHAARPLACALYPLGQEIDVTTGAVEYYLQPPLCGAEVPAGQARTLRRLLEDAGVTQRLGTDVRWAVVCQDFSETLHQAGGRGNPHFSAAVHRMARALYYDYNTQDDFYPQFCENVKKLRPLLSEILA